MEMTVPNRPPEREPNWRSMPDDELADRLREAFREVAPEGGYAILVDRPAVAEVEDVHYDPGTLDRRSPCHLDLGDIPAAEQTTDPSRVTCGACAASVANSQLPPEPEPFAVRSPEVSGRWAGATDAERAALLEQAHAEAVAEDANMCGSCGRPNPPDGCAINCGDRLDDALAAQDEVEQAESERRTVGLEVLTDGLRAAADDITRARCAEVGETDPILLPENAKVAVVIRRSDGSLIEVFDTDATWRQFGGPVYALGQLLQNMPTANGLVGLPQSDVLMPTPDVLAALAGKPVARYTTALEMKWETVPLGALVRMEIEVEPDRHEWRWLTVDDRTDCTGEGCPQVAQGFDQLDCRVVKVEGREPFHEMRWWPVAARIPATTEVEQP